MDKHWTDVAIVLFPWVVEGFERVSNVVGTGRPTSRQSICRARLHLERRDSMDDRPVPWLRANGNVAADGLQPFCHAGQAEPAPCHRLLRVEASAGILDCEIDGVALSVQR